MEVDNLPGPAPGQAFAEDVHNLVLDYCADGLEAFYSCVSTALAQRGTGQENGDAGPSGASHDDPVLASVGQGTQRLYDSLASKAGASLGLFEAVCGGSGVFRPHVEVAVPQVGPVHLPGGGGLLAAQPPLTPTRAAAGGEEEAGPRQGGEAAPAAAGAEGECESELLARIAQMKGELEQVDQRCAALRAEVQRVDKHIITAGDASDYLALSSAAAGHKATLRAVAAAAEHLANLMARAAALRAGAGAGGGMGGGMGADKLQGFQQAGAGAGVANAAGTSLAAVTALAELVRV
ncbi:hypothetical protein CHLRE_01g010816v5 [Chlamydomonas reinhardtii]|uniref:Uncharacterized protein n=1 Tax=Chlamydomonas reinhardtii TaxID=3055 RepID=A0A2K3E5I1_CHLRE|nr:uncharacterized protein CHLRE_01g010816v5 [Chlamydomonas reinhardtii]PNW88013.1 hypothetical protein CHLRE_01g010816v5 [Chlamydomonas reinhardtii]